MYDRTTTERQIDDVDYRAGNHEWNEVNEASEPPVTQAPVRAIDMFHIFRNLDRYAANSGRESASEIGYRSTETTPAPTPQPTHRAVAEVSESPRASVARKRKLGANPQGRRHQQDQPRGVVHAGPRATPAPTDDEKYFGKKRGLLNTFGITW